MFMCGLPWGAVRFYSALPLIPFSLTPDLCLNQANHQPSKVLETALQRACSRSLCLAWHTLLRCIECQEQDASISRNNSSPVRGRRKWLFPVPSLTPCSSLHLVLFGTLAAQCLAVSP